MGWEMIEPFKERALLGDGNKIGREKTRTVMTQILEITIFTTANKLSNSKFQVKFCKSPPTTSHL